MLHWPLEICHRDQGVDLKDALQSLLCFSSSSPTSLSLINILSLDPCVISSSVLQNTSKWNFGFFHFSVLKLVHEGQSADTHLSCKVTLMLATPAQCLWTSTNVYHQYKSTHFLNILNDVCAFSQNYRAVCVCECMCMSVFVCVSVCVYVCAYPSLSLLTLPVCLHPSTVLLAR